MDARLTVEQVLGLKTGDAHMIRNAGGIVTEDAIRSLIISHYLLGTQEFIIINHTDCGMLTFKGEDLAAKLEAGHGCRRSHSAELPCVLKLGGECAAADSAGESRIPGFPEIFPCVDLFTT